MIATTNDDHDRIAIAIDERQGEILLRQIYAFLGRFVAYPSEHAHVAHTLWIVHTHLMDRWESTPRIAFLSPEPGSGKTRALEAMESLVPNPVSAVNVTPAYLFRKVGSEDGLPTILFDEIDTVFGPRAKDNEEIRGLLNAGHRRNAVAGRCVTHGKTAVPEELPAYAAVALAGLGWLPETIRTRSVIIRMRRRHHSEQVEPFRHRIHSVEGVRLRDRILVWARSTPTEIDWPELPPEIQDRDADVWEPLVAVADMAGGDWPNRARLAAIALLTEAKEVEPSLGVRLLADLLQVFGTADAMPSKEVVAALRALEEAPWAVLKGKPIDERGVATRLKQYGIKSKPIWFGATQSRGYKRADLQDAWERYLPPSPARSVTSVTSVTKAEFSRNIAPSGVTDRGEPVTDAVTDAVTDGRQKKLNEANAVTDVTHVTHFPDDGRDLCQFCGQGGETVEVGIAGLETRLHRHCIERWTALDIPVFLGRPGPTAALINNTGGSNSGNITQGATPTFLPGSCRPDATFTADGGTRNSSSTETPPLPGSSEARPQFRAVVADISTYCAEAQKGVDNDE